MTRADVLRQMAWVTMAAGLLTGLPVAPAVGPTAAAMYQWTTPDGTIGLTDDPGRIPDQYRNTARPYGSPEESPPLKPPATTTPPRAPSSVATTSPAVSPEASVDQNGHDKAWWQARVQALTDQRADLIRQRSETEQKFNQLHYFGRETIEELALQKKLRQQLDDLTNEITTIDQQLTASLPDEARRAGAPSGWLRN